LSERLWHLQIITNVNISAHHSADLNFVEFNPYWLTNEIGKLIFIGSFFLLLVSLSHALISLPWKIEISTPR
jgi:hypothetical protein